MWWQQKSFYERIKRFGGIKQQNKRLTINVIGVNLNGRSFI